MIFEKLASWMPTKIGAMKIMLLVCALGNLAVLSAVAETTDGVNGAGQLEGIWQCVAATVDGRALPPTTTEALRLTLTKDRFKTERGLDVLFDSTYTIDQSKTPKEIDMVGTEGDLKGRLARGIYSLDSKELRICYVMPGLPRPKTFESAEGSQAFLVIWKRMSAK